jgi:hypothetical protein
LGVVSDRCVVPNIQIVITANTEQRRLVIGQCGSASFLSGTRAGALLTNLVQTGEPIEARRAAAIRDYLVPDWEAAERKMRAGMSVRHLAWVLPWMERCATSDELAHVVAKDGLVFRLLLVLPAAATAAGSD